MKHLHKFYNQDDLPWARLTWELYYSLALPPARPREISFWLRDCLKVFSTFKNLVVCTIAHSVLLWKGKWIESPLQETWPHLFSFARNDSTFLKDALAVTDLSDLFHLPLSKETTVQLNLFHTMLQNN
jgi:hypothetical protein